MLNVKKGDRLSKVQRTIPQKKKKEEKINQSKPRKKWRAEKKRKKKIVESISNEDKVTWQSPIFWMTMFTLANNKPTNNHPFIFNLFA